MSKATPGPWKVTDEHIVARDEYGGAQGLGPIIQTVNQRALEDCSPINVAFIVPIDTHAFEYPVGDSDANAALIAAAPALLAAAKAAMVKLEGTLPYVKEHIPRCEINAAIEQLTAAIAAAEGRGS